MTTESRLEALLEWTRFGQFVGVGMVGATIETIIVAILTTMVGFGPIAAKVVGAEASISTMFVMNDRVTFAEQGALGVLAFARRWVKSHLVRIVGLSVAFAVLYVLTGPIEFELIVAGLDLWPTVANGIGIGVGMLLNYAMEGTFTWRLGQ